MAKFNADYFVNEGNKLGYMRTQFDGSGNLYTDKFVADGDLVKGNVVEVTGYDATLRAVKVKATSGMSENVIGVAMFDYESGDEAAVECEGLFILTAAGAITIPHKVTSGASGTVAAAGTSDAVIGIALTPATTAGDRVYVKFSI